MHLHGHTFDVVRVAGSTVYNYANPIRRDVVSIGGGSDNVTIRFTTDNAGPWVSYTLFMGNTILLTFDIVLGSFAHKFNPFYN